MKNLKKFYKNTKNIKTLTDITSGKKKLSLRVIDWFVTNFSKKRNTMYTYKKKPFMVFLNYKSQLKAYSKKYFDPFCRRQRIDFEYTNAEGNVEKIETTIAQLNFFKWCIENGILTFIKKNFDEINKDMQEFTKNNNKNKKKQSNKKNKNSTTIGSETTSASKIIADEVAADSVIVAQEGGIEKKRQKRKEISSSAIKHLNHHNVKITLEFL